MILSNKYFSTDFIELIFPDFIELIIFFRFHRYYLFPKFTPTYMFTLPKILFVENRFLL